MAKRFGCGPQSMKTAVDRPSEKRHSKPIREVKIPDLSIPPCPENTYGCTYSDADNYDPISDHDDGSCVFAILPPCPTDLNGNGITDTADILQLLGNFGFSCPD